MLDQIPVLFGALIVLLSIGMLPVLAAVLAWEFHRRKKALSLVAHIELTHYAPSAIMMWILSPGVFLTLWFYLCFYLIQKKEFIHRFNTDPFGFFFVGSIVLIAGVIEGTVIFMGKCARNIKEPRPLRTVGVAAIVVGISSYVLFFFAAVFMALLIGM